LDEPLIWVRIVHFAATISLTGTLVFLTLIAEPTFRGIEGGKVVDLIRSRLSWIEWSSLALSVLSGAAWLVLKAAEIGDLPWQAVFSEGLLPVVLSGTDFGRDWTARAVLAVLLTAALFLAHPERASYRWSLVAACLLGAALAGTLAWAGHAAATPDWLGTLHIASDVLHLIGAGAWVGALLPLVLLIGAALAQRDAPSIVIARGVVKRFSTMGIASVGTLLGTGIINTWAIVGSLTALVTTAYGRLLLVKVALFLAMLCLAAINRFRLTPMLRQKPATVEAADALHRIRTNTVLEAVLGLAVVAIVGLLGTMSPGE
jgi:copper resistance protein D